MATRFCIPPEISDGNLFSAFTKFTRLSTVLARSRISSGVCLENIFRGNITFSSTVIESKRALPWNTIPIFWRRATCSLRFISAYFTPSYMMSPLSGVKSPNSDLRNTVLPEPLCPMMRFVLPFSNVVEIPLSTSTPLKDLRKFSTCIILQLKKRLLLC